MTPAIDYAAISDWQEALQRHICVALSELDAASQFSTYPWQRPDGGGGCTRVLADGAVFERAGVNFSRIHGTSLPPSATRKRPQLAGLPYHAMGVSLVLHPRNPFVPTAHANVRFFAAGRADEEPVWWFGGGFDLTPYYPFDNDILHWHRTAKSICDALDTQVYADLKARCDAYFFLPHRAETRGVGGLFFDDFNEFEFSRCNDFAHAVGRGFLDAYLPIVERRKNHPFTDVEREFQAYRRARYVEFNLVYDRGTLFGLQSGGRTESILMSMPPMARWGYRWQAKPGTAEARLQDYLRPRDWLTELADDS